MRAVHPRSALAVALLGLWWPTTTARAEYPDPDRSVLLICPWSVGGGTDRVSRQLAAFLEIELGVRVNVVNATGGAGVTGHSRGALADPDGYTILMMTVEINMLHWRGLTELTWESFEPLLLVNRDAAALFVHAESPWETVHDLTDSVRARPASLSASGTAAGGIWHLALAGWLSTEGLRPSDVRWIPFGGAGPSLSDLAARGLDMVCCSLPEARALIETDTIRCLGVMADAPVAGYEHVPTFRSLGIPWSMGGWRGLGMPKGTPPEVYDVLIPALRRIVTGETEVDGQRFPDFMAREGFDARWEFPEEFRETLARTDENLGRLLTSDEFRAIRGVPFGPRAFPAAIAALLVITLAAIAIGRRRRSRGSGELDIDPATSPPARIDALGTPAPVTRRGIAHFFEVLLAVGIYIAAVDVAGFQLTAGSIVLALLWRLGTHPVLSLLIAAVFTRAVWWLFSHQLGVELPRGLLEG